MYQKVKRQFQVLIQDHQIEFHDPSKEEKENLLRQFAGLANPSRVRMLSCCNDSLVLPGLTEKGRCVDREIVEETVGQELPSLKLNGTRKECGCYKSRDIGEYETCLHDCRYCYAVSDHAAAVRKSRRVVPTHEFLVGPA